MTWNRSTSFGFVGLDDPTPTEWAIGVWQNFLTNRPETGIPFDRDVVAEVDPQVLSDGLLPSVRTGIIRNLSTIEFGAWSGLYFAESQPTAPGVTATATALVDRFRGNPSAMAGMWLAGIPEPWGAIVRSVAACKRDTAGLVAGTPPSNVAAALNLLEARLFAYLASFFERTPVAAPLRLQTDTTPPSAPPVLYNLVVAFAQTQFLPTVPASPRTSYDAIREARILMTVNRAPGTTELRAAARTHLRTVLAGCAGYQRLLAVRGPTDRPFDPNPPTGLGGGPPVEPVFVDRTVISDRNQDFANHALAAALRESRVRIPADLDAMTVAAETAARDAALASRSAIFADVSPSVPCRALNAVATSNSFEPTHIQWIDLLRLIDIIDGKAARLPLPGDDGFAGIQRDLARGLQEVQIHNAPVVSVSADGTSIVIRSRFSLRMVGILARFDYIPGNDLFVYSDTSVKIELVLPPGATAPLPMSGDPRDAPGPARDLRVTVTPTITIPLLRAPTGASIAAILVGILGPLALMAIASQYIFERPISDRVARNINDLSSYLGPLFVRLGGPGTTLPAPSEFPRPFRLEYTLPAFEASFLGGSSAASFDLARLGITSLQSTLDFSGGRARFSVLIPTSAVSLPTAWGVRQWRPQEIALAFPTLTTGISWDVCSLVPEIAGREGSGAPSSVLVTLHVYLNAAPQGLFPFTVTRVEYRTASFDMLSASGGATRESGLRATDAMGRVRVEEIPELSPGAGWIVPSGRAFMVRIVVGAVAWLDAMRASGMSSPRTQVVITTNLGVFVADFARELDLLRQWGPFLRDASATEAVDLRGRLVMGCNEARIMRMLVVPVGTTMNPFPPAFLRETPVLGDLDGVLGDLDGILDPARSILNPGALRPMPTPGEPRPIVDRPWLYGPPASPVLRLDPIVDLALRAARPQPVSPSV